MAKSITQKQFYTALISLVEENPDFTVEADGMSANADEVVKFLNSRIESLEKKATKTSDKTNTAQAEVDERVLSVLAPLGAKVKTITEMVNEQYSLEGENAYSSSKVTASLRRLVSKGLAKNEVVKKDSLYSLAD